MQPRPEINKPGNHLKHLRLRRMRVVFSWFKAWCASIAHFVQGINGSHSLVINVVDDSNCVLSQLVEGGAPVAEVQSCHRDEPSPVYGDTVQQFRGTLLPNILGECTSCVIDKANASTLGAELRSWLVTFLGKVGWRFKDLESVWMLLLSFQSREPCCVGTLL